MTNNFIIAISGKRGSGKTTLADMLVRKGITRCSFAATLKSRVIKDFGLSEDQVYGNSKELVDPRFSKTPRDIMTSYGQYFRSVDPDFWVKAFLRDVSMVNGPVVVDDMRFKNEARFLKTQPYKYFVRLARLPEDNVYKGENLDSSETDLDDYDGFNLVVPGEQNRTLADLESTAERIMDVYYQNVSIRAVDTQNVVFSNNNAPWDDSNFSGFNS